MCCVAAAMWPYICDHDHDHDDVSFKKLKTRKNKNSPERGENQKGTNQILFDLHSQQRAACNNEWGLQRRSRSHHIHPRTEEGDKQGRHGTRAQQQLQCYVRTWYCNIAYDRAGAIENVRSFGAAAREKVYDIIRLEESVYPFVDVHCPLGKRVSARCCMLSVEKV